MRIEYFCMPPTAETGTWLRRPKYGCVTANAGFRVVLGIERIPGPVMYYVCMQGGSPSRDSLQMRGGGGVETSDVFVDVEGGGGIALRGVFSPMPIFLVLFRLWRLWGGGEKMICVGLRLGDADAESRLTLWAWAWASRTAHPGRQGKCRSREQGIWDLPGWRGARGPAASLVQRYFCMIAGRGLPNFTYRYVILEARSDRIGINAGTLMAVRGDSAHRRVRELIPRRVRVTPGAEMEMEKDSDLGMMPYKCLTCRYDTVAVTGSTWREFETDTSGFFGHLHICKKEQV
ncbi:hypothetical protein B0H11DRAFT_1934802 [Mycena galericulata]|nr:hypothetical protein B0H11DRAFT_1934802 [Mycena galericulata]